MVERISTLDETYCRGYANHIQRYQFASGYCSRGVVLDAGCGSGYGSDYLASRGGFEVVAVDISEEALAEARSTYRRPNLRYLRADVERLEEAADLPGRFQAVVNLENLEHLQRPRDFLRGARALLGDDGVLVVSSPNGELTEFDERGAIKNEFHVREYSAEELLEMLRAEFAEVDLFGQWRTPEGKMRMEIERDSFDTLNELYYSPSHRLWRAVRRLLGKAGAPPPRFTAAGTSYPWDFTIRPLAERPFPWEPEVLLAVARTSRAAPPA